MIFLIRTKDRPYHLKTCLESIQARCPGSTVYIVDSSHRPDSLCTFPSPDTSFEKSAYPKIRATLYSVPYTTTLLGSTLMLWNMVGNGQEVMFVDDDVVINHVPGSDDLKEVSFISAQPASPQWSHRVGGVTFSYYGCFSAFATIVRLHSQIAKTLELLDQAQCKLGLNLGEEDSIISVLLCYFRGLPGLIDPSLLQYQAPDLPKWYTINSSKWDDMIGENEELSLVKGLWLDCGDYDSLCKVMDAKKDTVLTTM